MARGHAFCFQTRTIAAGVSLSLPQCKLRFLSLHHLFHAPQLLPSTRLSSTCVRAQESTTEIAKYKKAFSRRMAMVGLRPHNRIALGVSGGPDSMALCVLAADWKTEGSNAFAKGELIDGLLAIIVDHGLREESKDEADLVGRRVSEMGIRYEVHRCDWLDGKPKQGHLQETARERRYQIFHDVCIRNRTCALLIAHHADDQAELFILRSSRNSGVLGLAGMAFTSQLFSSHVHSSYEDLKNQGILVVRALLDFSKGDMYRICKEVQKDWVEDPTNQNPLFARSRIRKSLGNLSSCIFNSELHALISACRKTRTYVDKICQTLINQAVTIMEQGYAVIDLVALNLSKIEDICLSKCIALVLQFISQRQRPIRGSTSKLLLEYIRTIPCKKSFTAAGCYLSPAPGSKGTKALVCCSVDCPLPSKTELFYTLCSEKLNHFIPNELEQIIVNGKSYSDQLVPDASEVQFLDLGSSSVLDEARKLDILSESTYKKIIQLQKEEIKYFRSKDEEAYDYQSKHEVENTSTPRSESLQPGQTCYFMNRFYVTWKLSKENTGNAFPQKNFSYTDLEGGGQNNQCSDCVIGHDIVAEVRHMVEADWLYLVKLSRCPSPENFEQKPLSIKAKNMTEKTTAQCLSYSRLSAQRALFKLKSIPLAARKSLPVLVTHDGLLLSAPSIGFKHCPCLMVSAVLKPRVPLGGGYTSFI